MIKRNRCTGITDVEKNDMISLWRALVDIDSGSENKAGVDAVGKKIEEFLRQQDICVRYEVCQTRGNVLVAEYGDMTKPFIIFLGHMDTVFSDGTVKKRPFRIEKNKVYGPGVLDMKGGIVIALFVMKKLKEQGYRRFPIKLILAGDEEIAHQGSDTVTCIRKECNGAAVAFNFETGFMDHSIVTARKGTFRAVFEVYGKGAHAGNNPQDGCSAIKEMAYKILELENLNDFKTGNTVNVGVITGGTVANAIPEQCKIIVDMRFINETYKNEYMNKFKKIAETVHIPGTKTIITFPIIFDAMNDIDETKQLFDQVQTILYRQGFPAITAKKAGGGSDSAHTTAMGIPTLCAMGVQGTGNHTVEETADLESLFMRTHMMLTIMKNLK